jgi:hypothetical protein
MFSFKLALAPPLPPPEAHQREVFNWARGEAVGAAEGANVKLSRWWSYEQSSREMFKRRYIDLTTLLWIGYRRGWWKSAGQCPLLSLAGGEAAAEGGAPMPGEGPEVEQEGEEAPEGEEEGAEGERQSAAKARPVAKTRREKVANLLRFACVNLSKQLQTRLWALMAFGPLPLEEWSRQLMSALKSVPETRAKREDIAQGALLEPALGVLQHMCSEEFAEQIDFLYLPYSERSGLQREQDALFTGTAWAFCVALAGRLSSLHFMCCTPPASFMSGQSDSELLRAAWLEEMKEVWEYLCLLETTALADQEAHEFCQNMSWASHQWVREVFLELAECQFERTSAHLQGQLRGFAASHFSTLVIENSFNDLRRQEALSRTRVLEASAIYHRLNVEAEVLAQHGRPPVALEAKHRAAAAGQRLPASTWTGEAGSCSLPSEELAILTRARASWPTTTPAGLELTGMMLQLLKCAKGDWGIMRAAWLSLLVPPGVVLIDTTVGRAHAVLHSTALGSAYLLIVGWIAALHSAFCHLPAHF